MNRPALFTAYMLLIIGMVVLVLLVAFSALPLNHDAALFLQCGQLLLQGNTPYVDVIELNPPLAQYLYAVPVFIARYLHTDLIMTFQMLIAGFAIWSSLMLLVAC